MDDLIPFNKPHITGNEIIYLKQTINALKLSGDGVFTQRCQSFLENRYGFKKTFLTTSCSDALEMCALLIDAGSEDEIIIPSYTFVSTANAFVLRGAKIVFADSEDQTPNIDISKIESLITSKTKAIVCVHYAGIACDMEPLMALSSKYNLYVIEDAAHAIDGYYHNKPLGSIGHLAAFSFHDTKNITCGEGGMLVINNSSFLERAEIIREKGTNRSKFIRGEIDKYEWVDMGSSFLPSDLLASFLYAQLEQIDNIQYRRKSIWNKYYNLLHPLSEKGLIRLPQIPAYSSNNAHMFYLVCNNKTEKDKLLKYLRHQNIHAAFHYLSLHQSEYYLHKHDGRILINCEKYSDNLIRLPFYFDLNNKDIEYICSAIHKYFGQTIAA